MFDSRMSRLRFLGLAGGALLTPIGAKHAAGWTPPKRAMSRAGRPAAVTGTITVWAQGAEGEGLPALLEEFEAENPEVSVNVEAIPWDAAHNKYQTAIAGGATPDVAQMGTTWMGDFADAFDPTPSDLDSSVFFPGSVASTEVNGTSVGVPWYVDTRVIYYRTDLAEQAGFTEFPTNWDDFKAMAAAMQTEAGAEYGIRLPAGSADSFQSMLPFAWSNGVELMNEDRTEWTLNTPEMVEAMEYYQSFFTEGIANKNPATGAGAAESAFVDGSQPMMIEGPFMIGALAEAGGAEFAGQYAVATMPKKLSATSFVGGSDLVVFKSSSNREAAWALVRWLSQPDVQVKWYAATGDLPAVQAAWEDPTLADDDKVAVFGEQLTDTKSPPAIVTWTQVSAEGDRQLERIVKADKDPTEAMEDLQEEADSIGTEG